jgi:hypothetical protein
VTRLTSLDLALETTGVKIVTPVCAKPANTDKVDVIDISRRYRCNNSPGGNVTQRIRPTGPFPMCRVLDHSPTVGG